MGKEGALYQTLRMKSETVEREVKKAVKAMKIRGPINMV